MASIHEYINYRLGEVKELFDTCIIKAKLISVDAETNTAVIETDPDKQWGTLNNVPIFYHCQKHDRVEMGWKAFYWELNRNPGANVYVLVLCKDIRTYEGKPSTSIIVNDLKVIGFADAKLRLCASDLLIVKIGKAGHASSSFNAEAYLVWDLEEDAPVGTTIEGDERPYLCDPATFQTYYGKFELLSLPIIFDYLPSPMGIMEGTWAQEGFLSFPVFEAYEDSYNILGLHAIMTPTYAAGWNQHMTYEPFPDADNVTWAAVSGCTGNRNTYNIVPIVRISDGNVTFGCQSSPRSELKIDDAWVGRKWKVSGVGKIQGNCEILKGITWPPSFNLDNTLVYTSFLEQDYTGTKYWELWGDSCPPYLCAAVRLGWGSLLFPGMATEEITMNNPGVAIHDNGQGLLWSSQGDWGSYVLWNKVDQTKGGFAQCILSYSLTANSGLCNLANSIKSCKNGNPFVFEGEPLVSASYTMKTHHGEIGSFVPAPDLVASTFKHFPDLGKDGGFGSHANLKYATGHAEDLQVEIYLYQNELNGVRDYGIHGVINRRPDGDTEDYSQLDPKDNKRHYGFEAALIELYEFANSRMGVPAPEDGIEPQLEFNILRVKGGRPVG